MPDSVNCVFVHGWAMNSAVWDECITRLPDWINVIVVDLPGHGTMADVDFNSLDDCVQALVPLVHQPVIWVGWSLGGLAVLRLAELYPQRVAAVLLVATNPCFVRQADWSCAVEKKVFSQFSSDLKNNQEKTIRRFLALAGEGNRGCDASGQAAAAKYKISRSGFSAGTVIRFESIAGNRFTNGIASHRLPVALVVRCKRQPCASAVSDSSAAAVCAKKCDAVSTGKSCALYFAR